MEVGVRNDFCRQDSSSPVLVWLSQAVPGLHPMCPPLGPAPES